MSVENNQADVSYIIVIPARYASTRLPGKLLKLIDGQSIIQHVHRNVSLSSAKQVVIATDDERIEQHANAFEAEVCLTSAEHESGTQRIAEVIKNYNISDDTIVVNVQGDEPFMPVACIEQVAQLLADNPHAVMATLATPLVSEEEVFDPNTVKVVANKNKEAMYFSRATIPWHREDYPDAKINEEHLFNTLRHIGIYAYRAGFIRQYVRYDTSQLEQIEMLEQLRVLWNGHTIMVDKAVEIPGPGIDTQQDLDNAVAYYKNRIK